VNEHPRSSTDKQHFERAKARGGFAGQSLVEKIRDKLDDAIISLREGERLGFQGNLNADRAYGRVEGVAAALGILRSTSTTSEIEEAKERLGLQ
jgi:hypothetical protein